MKTKVPIQVAWNVLVRKAPIDAQLIITRRCNLSCGYCNEYDNVSPPIPLNLLKERIDALHRLKVAIITLLGGEPLLHPNLSEIVSYIRRKSIVSIITNGFLLSKELIEALNRAGLDHMQISVDALTPSNDLFIQKSLKSLRNRLRVLKELATFSFHINCVLCPQSVEEFPALIEEVSMLGFPMSVGLVHDMRGHIEIKGEPYQSLWEYFYTISQNFSSIEREYGARLLQGERPEWHCRAGSRYLYVDEYGKAQFCSAQHGRLNKDVTAYTSVDLRHYGRLKKGCESGCTLSCVYRCSAIDNNAPWTVFKTWLQKAPHFSYQWKRK